MKTHAPSVSPPPSSTPHIPFVSPLASVNFHLKANVINEIARSLKPGGKVIVVDAAQPEFDGAGVCTLDGLPSWGEMTPIYRAYLKSDLEYGLIKVRRRIHEDFVH